MRSYSDAESMPHGTKHQALNLQSDSALGVNFSCQAEKNEEELRVMCALCPTNSTDNHVIAAQNQ